MDPDDLNLLVAVRFRMTKSIANEDPDNRSTEYLQQTHDMLAVCIRKIMKEGKPGDRQLAEQLELVVENRMLKQQLRTIKGLAGEMM